jgi:hypothetical protein
VTSIEQSVKSTLNQSVTSTGNAEHRHGSNTNSSAPTATRYDHLPPRHIIGAAVDLYFRYCHNQPYSLFHEGSLRSKLELDEPPNYLAFALVASTVRYSGDDFFHDKKAATVAYAQHSWKSIDMPWDGLQSDDELAVVQTILLLAIIDYTGTHLFFFFLL